MHQRKEKSQYLLVLSFTRSPLKVARMIELHLACVSRHGLPPLCARSNVSLVLQSIPYLSLPIVPLGIEWFDCWSRRWTVNKEKVPVVPHCALHFDSKLTLLLPLPIQQSANVCPSRSHRCQQNVRFRKKELQGTRCGPTACHHSIMMECRLLPSLASSFPLPLSPFFAMN